MTVDGFASRLVDRAPVADESLGPMDFGIVDAGALTMERFRLAEEAAGVPTAADPPRVPRRKGRPEAPLPESGPLVPFARRLRQVRDQHGMTYRAMAKRAMYAVPALSKAADGRNLPSRRCLVAYLTALGATDEEHAELLQMWTAVRDKLRHLKLVKDVRRPRVAEPAASNDSSEQFAETAARGRSVLDTILKTHGDKNIRTGTVVNSTYFTADPAEVENDEQFATALGQVMAEAELAVRDVVTLSTRPDMGQEQAGLGRTTVYNVLNGKTKPTVPFTRQFLQACGMSPALIPGWTQRLKEIRAADDVRPRRGRHSQHADLDVDWGQPLGLPDGAALESVPGSRVLALGEMVVCGPTPITTDFSGVLTDEVGMVAGDLELSSIYEVRQQVFSVVVNHRGGTEQYTVSGSRQTINISLHTLSAMHRLMCGVLNQPQN